MGNIAKEHLQQFLPVETVDMGRDHIAAVFNIALESDRSAYNRELIQCQSYIKQYDTTVALGSFLEIIRQLLRENTPSAAKLAVTMLLLTVGETLQQIPLQTFQATQWSLTYVQAHIERLETLDSVFMWLRKKVIQTSADISAQLKPAKNLNLVQQVRLLVDEQLLDQNLSTKTVSERMGLSVNYVRNFFKTETGQSLMEYINNRRLDKVAELMATTELSIDEIVLSCGFVSTVSFYPLFKKKYAVTPAKYRKEHQQL